MDTINQRWEQPFQINQKIINVWPALSARGFFEIGCCSVCVNVSGLEELTPAMMEIRTLRSS